VSEYGFHLARLSLSGAGLIDAEVGFSTGLNVISGPSDTGKTFILQCIDYLLGASTKPEAIPEASRYELALLELIAREDGARYTLTRSLRGGDLTLRRPDGRDEVLAEQHSATRDDTVSHFLLDITGLTNKRIRKNQRGETRSLSFRDLAHLVVISEESILRSHSPILSGQYTTRTAEKSVFRLLLSGLDDSSVVAADEPRISRARTEAREEVLRKIAAQSKQQLAELHVDATVAELREQLNRLEATYEDASSQLSMLGASVDDVETRRRDSWKRLRRVESRLEVLRGLSTRFSLLREQYGSDLRRLDAITEAGMRLDDLGVERCPVCGALPENHDVEHRSERVSPGTIATASRAEAIRIRSLMSDLDTTRSEVASETEQLTMERAELQGMVSDLASTLVASLRPQARDLTETLWSVREERDRVRRAIELLQRLDDLDAIAEDFTQLSDRTKGQSAAKMPSADLEAFAQEAEKRLRAWNFPDLGRVTFSEEDWDIIISGRRRTSHGKGIRAVTHAGFTTALLSFCEQRRLPHPGFIAIDSPLVVYREPDTATPEFSADVKAAFYRDLAESFSNSQILILENEEPPEDLVESKSATIIRFTGTTIGRRGFFPS
jgi:hypothetical protein